MYPDQIEPLRKRLKEAARAMGTNTETFVSGDGPVNDAMSAVRTAISEASDLLHLRSQQYEERRANPIEGVN